MQVNREYKLRLAVCRCLLGQGSITGRGGDFVILDDPIKTVRGKQPDVARAAVAVVYSGAYDPSNDCISIDCYSAD